MLRRFASKKPHRTTCIATLQEIENPSSRKSLPQSIRDKCKTKILAREEDVQVVERLMKQQQVLADMSEKGPRTVSCCQNSNLHSVIQRNKETDRCQSPCGVSPQNSDEKVIEAPIHADLSSNIQTFRGILLHV